MDMDSLTKGQQRKLNALRKSLGEDIANDAFSKWLKTQQSGTTEKPDPIAENIASALNHFSGDKSFRLGRKGYVIKRAKGRGVSGFVVSKLD